MLFSIKKDSLHRDRRYMKIQSKAIIIIFLLCIVIFGSLHVISSFLIQPSYKAIENQENEKSINQTLSTINYRLSELEGNAIDYSAWDDTYIFVQDANQEYIDKNLDTVFENLNLNIVVIMDNTGNVVYSQSYDSNQCAMVTTSQETQTFLKSDGIIWNFQSTDDLISGLLLLDGKPVLVATAPILTSQNEGPIMGGMLFGKFLDAIETERLKDIMGLDFSLMYVNDFKSQNIQNSIIVETLVSDEESIVISEISPEVMSGYTLVNDIHDSPLFVLQVSQDRTAYQQGIWSRNIFLVAALSLTVTFGVCLFFFLRKEIVEPMTNLAAHVRSAFSEPSTKNDCPKLGTDEITILANVIKDSFSQRLDTMNEVSRMVAHDLRNPLTGIKGAVYSLRRNYGQKMGEKGESLLKVIDNCVEYSDKIVKDLWEYSSEIKLDKIKTSPYKLVNNSLSTLVVSGNVKVINEASEELSLVVDTGKMERVFSNLIKNAIDAMPNGGTLRIASKMVKNEVEIDFCDTGVGMSKEIMKNLWMPFFTTKAKGMGVGLSICKRIIDSHKGRIEVQSKNGEGTCFIIFLPSEQN